MTLKRFNLCMKVLLDVYLLVKLGSLFFVFVEACRRRALVFVMEVCDTEAPQSLYESAT